MLDVVTRSTVATKDPKSFGRIVSVTISTPPNPGYVGHFVSAPWRSSGKSMVSMGLARAALQRATGVQTFKKGPDFIDPLWLKAASGHPCYNLDPYIQSSAELQNLYYKYPSDVVLVEGTMGLHDGLAVDGSDSNAAIAKQLNLPVLLVIDCGGMHRTIASLVNGLTQFDPELNFSGLILNRVRSERHGNKIERAIDEYCDLDVVGAIPEQEELRLKEAELGLVPAPDHPAANQYIDRVANALEATCDLDAIFRNNVAKHDCSPIEKKEGAIPSSLSIGIARDEAFHFYYEDDLEALRARGINLVEFSPLHDSFPDDLDGLLIGGGFPERHAAGLSGNLDCRSKMLEAINNGLPVRAECGGLMYLCRSIESEKVVWPMVGALPGAVTMQSSPQGRGYMKLKFNPALADKNSTTDTFPAHEFHHSSIVFDAEPDFAYSVKRGHGVDGQNDGICVNNVIASYAHMRHTQATPWIDWFLSTIQRAQQGTNKNRNHV